MNEKMKIGISSCLIGNEVRYNGGHARDLFVINTFAPYVDFVAVCPEVECGMPVPREAVHLVGDVNNPRLMSTKTNIDFTSQMQNWSHKKVLELEKEQLCGFIFKKGSPSCGLHRIRVYQGAGKQPLRTGIGMFTRIFIDHFPTLPVEDEGRLHDPTLREHFIEKIFIMQRWRQLIKKPHSRHALIAFHTGHKLIFLAHNQVNYRRMGKFIANIAELEIETAYQQYFILMTTLLKFKTTPKKHVNVLMHMLGFFKKELTSAEKEEMLTIIDQFSRGLLPLIVPITMFKHYIRKYNKTYLANQHYVEPHPLELKLRNHC